LKNCTSRDQHTYSVAVIIKSICAWCSRVLRNGIEPPTHGICDACICKLCGITLEDLVARRTEWAAELASREVQTTSSSDYQGVSQAKSDADPEPKAPNPRFNTVDRQCYITHLPHPQMKLIEIRMPIFDIDEALKPIDRHRVLTLLQIGLEECGENGPGPTEWDFYDALTEVRRC
jgi:hypothetical protein